MKSLLASLVVAMAPALVLAQAPAPAKPAPRPAAKPQARPAPAARPSPAAQKAVEEAVPLEEPDPTIKLSDAELETAKKVHVGEFPCELGSNIRVRALRRDGFFLVTVKNNRFVMHPVESRTGAIRLEDPARGAMLLQLGNKSMVMSQKLGQRLADECQSPEQASFAAEMKNRPAINLLEANPPQNAASTPKSGPN